VQGAQPTHYRTLKEPHERGNLLVAAVFDALTNLPLRVADLIRISTEGTGVLPDGELHSRSPSTAWRRSGQIASHVPACVCAALELLPLRLTLTLAITCAPSSPPISTDAH